MFDRHRNVPFVLRATQNGCVARRTKARGIGKMNRETQLQVQAYLDNELSPGEARNISKLISSDAEARDLFGELKSTREALVANEPLPSLPESREFYWSKIQRAIERAERTNERVTPSASRPWWLRIMAPIAGAVALFAVLLSVVGPNRSPSPVAPQAHATAAPLHNVEEAEDVSLFTF